MGRKGNFVEKTPRGPGRKAKKQKPPALPTDMANGNRYTHRWFVLFCCD